MDVLAPVALAAALAALAGTWLAGRRAGKVEPAGRGGTPAGVRARLVDEASKERIREREDDDDPPNEMSAGA